MGYSTPGFPVLHYLLELAQTHVHLVSDAIEPSRPLFLSSPFALIFSNVSALHIRWPKFWSFSFSTSPSNEYLGLIPEGLTSLMSLLSKGLSRVFSRPQFEMILFINNYIC